MHQNNTYLELVDTHSHVHESALYDQTNVDRALSNALAAGVTKIFVVGTNIKSSMEAVALAEKKEWCYAIIGVHPHDSKEGIDQIGQMLKRNNPKVVGIGEIGLDYHYDHSPRHIQIAALEQQLQWALEYQLPISFHVRDAFDDFWPILANFPSVKGVLHSFTDSTTNLEIALGNNLYIGVNGISTFSKTNQQMWDAIPLENMLLETDAPFLTPAPYRGRVNEPAFVRHVAEYHAKRREVELEHLARATSANASKLFSI